MLSRNHAFWSLGFRPFFSIAMFMAMAVAAIWLLSGQWPVADLFKVIHLFAALLLLDAFGPGFFADKGFATSGLAAIALGSGILLLWSWRPRAIMGRGMLLVLHLGYLWLLVHLALLAGSQVLFTIPASLSLHAFTFGCLGNFALGMMARVSYGHTGRPIAASRSLLAAVALINLAAVVRVFWPLFWPTSAYPGVMLAGTLWILAFSMLGTDLIPKLLTPRVDGREY